MTGWIVFMVLVVMVVVVVVVVIMVRIWGCCSHDARVSVYGGCNDKSGGSDGG